MLRYASLTLHTYPWLLSSREKRRSAAFTISTVNVGSALREIEKLTYLTDTCRSFFNRGQKTIIGERAGEKDTKLKAADIKTLTKFKIYLNSPNVAFTVIFSPNVTFEILFVQVNG